MKKGLAQLAGQLLTIWKQLGLNQRISVILATGAVLAGLLGLAFFSSRTTYGLLFSRLSDADAAKAFATLDEEKVPYEIRGAGSIYVPQDRVLALRAKLASKGISGGLVANVPGYSVLKETGIGATDIIQQLMAKQAIEGELTRTISNFEGIESARVMIVTPKNRLLTDPNQKTTASVAIKVQGNARLSGAAVNAIRNLVASSVEGLHASNVTVVDNNLVPLYVPDEENSAAGSANKQLDIKRSVEDYYRQKVQSMLNEVVGPNLSHVVVDAKIDWKATTTYLEKPDPDNSVPRQNTITKKSVQSITTPGNGVPGVGANIPGEGTNAAPATAQVTNKTEDQTTTTEFEVGREVSSILQNAGDIIGLSASVVVATKYTNAGAIRQLLPRGTNELESLRRLVASAVGIRENTPNANNWLTLEELPFNDQPIVELTQKLDRDQTRQFWVQLGVKLLYPAAALAVVMLFWRSMKSTKTDDITLGIPLGDLAMAGGNGNGNGNGHGGSGLYGRKNEPKVVTAEVLNQLIRENPANMTQAVRNWLVRGKPAK